MNFLLIKVIKFRIIQKFWLSLNLELDISIFLRKIIFSKLVFIIVQNQKHKI